MPRTARTLIDQAPEPPPEIHIELAARKTTDAPDPRVPTRTATQPEVQADPAPTAVITRPVMPQQETENRPATRPAVEPAHDPAAPQIQPQSNPQGTGREAGNGHQEQSDSQPAVKAKPRQVLTADPVETPAARSHEAPVVQSAVREGLKPTNRETPADATPAPQAARLQATEKPAVAQRLQPVREIAMRVAGDAEKPVDIRLSERAGKVEVAVRTQDSDLRASLQGEIGRLVENLEREGFHAKAWTPTEPATVRANEPGATAGGGAPDDSQRRNSQDTFGGERRQQQQESDQGWLEELEDSRRKEEHNL
jgi:hypothetical protein